MTVIITLFVLYTIGCCLDGPDLKPKWKEWLGTRLYRLSDSLHPIPRYVLPPQPLEVEVTRFDARKVESNFLITENDMMMARHMSFVGDMETAKERILSVVKMKCARELTETIASSHLITYEVDEESAWPGVLVRAWLYVGTKG